MKPAAFFRKRAKQIGKTLQLDPEILETIAGLKLPFTSKSYYSFCDKYLDDDANDALFLDGDDTYFREIAADYDTFRYLQFAGKLFDKQPVLVDIGCGVGNMIHFAEKLGYKAFGYELNSSLEPIHRKLKAEVIYGDILQLDLARLKTADVVYLYRPMNDKKLMDRLFALIYEHSAKNVIIFYNYPHSRDIINYENIALGKHDDMILLFKKP